MVERGTLANETILLMAYSAWDVFRQDNELASLFAAHNRVLYVEKQPRLRDRRPRPPSGGWQDPPSGPVRRSETLVSYAPPPRLPWLVQLWPSALKRLGFRCSLQLNAYRLKVALKAVLEELGWRPSVLWCYEADTLLLRRYFDVQWAGYRVYDEISLFPFWGPIRDEYDRFERAVIGQADHVFASSRAQYEKRRPWHNRVHYLPNAGAFDRYNRYNEPGCAPSRPVDLPHSGPILMFIGTLDYRLDYDALVTMAQQNPEWQWVFVGPTKLTSAGDGPGRLQALANVHLLGAKPPRRLPDYLYFADVSLIPYRISESTQTMFPWKVYEHLAMGKPIVTTALPALEEVRDCLYWTTSEERFVESIRSALGEQRGDPRIAARVRLAERNSWQDRMAEIAGIAGGNGKRGTH
jgi:glycosyltransferase involved in cell wall biosynthesis